MEGLAARTVNSGLVGAEELIHDLFSNPYVYIHVRMGLVRNLVFEGKSTVIIRDKALQDQDGHQGSAGIHVRPDGQTWLGFLAKERSLVWALLRRKIRVKGSPRLLLAFGKCFP